MVRPHRSSPDAQPFITPAVAPGLPRLGRVLCLLVPHGAEIEESEPLFELESA